MNEGLGEREAVLAVRALDDTARTEVLDGQGAVSVVLKGEKLEGPDDLGVGAQGEEVLGCLEEADDGDAENGEDKHQSAAGEHDVAPAHVVLPCARFDRGAVPLLRYYHRKISVSRCLNVLRQGR